MSQINRQILLVEKPTGKLLPQNFKMAEAAIPEPKDGEVLLRVLYISLDAANRAWMQGATYRAAVEANTVTVAEQLPARLLVISDAVFLDQRNEIMLRIAAQRRLAEVRIAGQKVRRCRVQVGEIAAPAAGNADFLGGPPRLLDHSHAATATSRNAGAHQARRASAEDNDVINQRLFHECSDGEATGTLAMPVSLSGDRHVPQSRRIIRCILLPA